MTVATPIRPQRTKGVPTPEGDFVVFEAVPIFDAHTGDDGVEYNEALLQRIAENCNRRIRHTNDWAPVVIGHTRDNDEKASVDDDPEVVGLAGPFYVADFTNADGKPSRAIHATFWIFPEDEKAFLKHPRRSVEIWPEEMPENRFFDPISALGAETPKRDLGTIYSRRRSLAHSDNQRTCVPQRYCMPGPLRYSKRYAHSGPIKYSEDGGGVSSTPGGNNTFIPGADLKKKPLQNAKGSDMAFTPDDLNQILEALKPSMQAMIDMSMSTPDAGIDAGLPGDVPPGPAIDAPGGDPGLDAPGGPPGLDAAGGAPAMGAPPAAPPSDVPDFDSMDDESKLYGRGLGRKFMKYKKDEGWDDDGESSFMSNLDDDDKSHLGSYMKYMCDDEDGKTRYAERYAKSPIGGTDLTETAGDSSPSGSMNATEMKPGEPEKYGKGTTMSTPTQYAKIRQERDEAVQRNTKTQRELDELKQKYAKQEQESVKLREKERYARRYAALKNLEPDYAFDPEEEMGITEDFSDEQFDRHIKQIIPGRYSKVSNSLLPVEAERKFPSDKNDKAQRYAKQALDQVQKYRKSGREVDYKRMLDHMMDNDGNVDEAKLFSHNGNGHA